MGGGGGGAHLFPEDVELAVDVPLGVLRRLLGRIEGRVGQVHEHVPW